MTTEKALEILKEWIIVDHKIIGNNPQSDFDKFIAEKCEAIEVAIEVLRKQIPEKVVALQEPLDCCACPECGRYHNKKFVASYCDLCGQALDWSETEK